MPASRAKKILLGCLAAVLGLVLAVVILAFLFVNWLKTPAPPLEGARLIDGATALYADLRLAREDIAARGLVREFLRTQRQPPDFPTDAPVPPFLRWLATRVPQREPTDPEIDRLLPIRVVLTRRVEVTGAVGSPLVALNAAGLGNGLRFAAFLLSFSSGRDPDLQRFSHGGETIFRFRAESPVWVCILSTDVLLSHGEIAVRDAIDLMARGPEAAAEGPVGALLAPLPPDSLLRVAVPAGQVGTLADMIALAGPEWATIGATLSGYGAVSAWGRLTSVDSLNGELRLEPAGNNRASQLTPPTLELSIPLTEGSVTVRLRPTGVTSDGVTTVALELDGIQATVRQALRRLHTLRMGAGRENDRWRPPSEEPGP